jgi:polysaccharide biosynthesis protein PslG
MTGKLPRLWLLLVFIVLFVACRDSTGPTEKPPAAPPATALPDDLAPEQIIYPVFASPEYGVQAFLWWRPEIALRDLALINELGFHWVKQAFAWRDIETLEKGKYDWWRPDYIVDAVHDAGLKLVVRIDRQPFWTQPGDQLRDNRPPDDLQDFGDFCGVMAERYRGRIAAYQVWNEPNLSREWGDRPPDPAAYTALLKVCYEAIKAADPEATVISAGLAPTGTGLPAAIPDGDFLQGMYDAGAAAYFDVLGVNAPGYKAPPETPPEEGESVAEYGGGRWFVFRHVEDMRAIMVANGDSGKQVAILEMGWTTDNVNPDYAWHAVSEQQQAEYLVRAYRYAAENWQPWMGLMVTIYIADYDWTEADEQWWWAITLPDGTPRPAFEALQTMDKVSP